VFETKLPNSHRVFCPNPLEVSIIYEQINSYFDHGFKVEEGDTVFDVGANIGLFSLTVCDWGRRPARIFAFEPIPATFEALKANVERYQARAVIPLRCAVSRRSGKRMFTYYPLATAMSSAYPYDVHSADQLEHAFRDILPHLPTFLRWIERLPSGPQAVLIKLLLKVIFYGCRVACQTISLSDALREHGVDKVDLLKIDVEKAELEVLQGLDAQDWPKLQKIVVEVHDIEGRLNAVLDLLRYHGFTHVICEQEPGMKGFEVFTVFARRNVAV
jgi:31-O-methyltransferase